MTAEDRLRKNAHTHATQDFFEILSFYFYEYRTEVTPNTMAKIFIEEFASMATNLAKEMNEDDDDYTIPIKKDLTTETECITIKL